MEYTEEEIIGQFRYMIADFRETKNEITVTEEGINTLETLLNLMEKQQKEINELKQENEYLNFICESDASNYINKEAIREKIRELEDEKGCYFSQCFIEERDNKIQVLKELLGE